MKARLAIMLVLITSLLWGGVAIAQTNAPGPIHWYIVQAGTVAGGSYQLTGLALRQAQGDTWRVSGAAGGGGYALAALSQPALRGSGCCCTYLPCILRQH